MPDTYSAMFQAHRGKVTDKWSAYLPVYDEVFAPFRAKPVRLLEIGVQNGGSLEVHSKYFSHHEAIVGCDIHRLCAGLTYINPRIKVVVGDCKAETTHAQILDASDSFDLIIDDGSHRSDDIIQTFLMYFPALKPGGVYAVEDLHGSYWRSFDGGLFHPRSSLSFFKLLIDVINAEHWGIEASPRDLIDRDFPHYSALTAALDWTAIASVSFHNSMCIVRACARPGEQTLGLRHVRGDKPTVVDVTSWNGTEPIRSDERGNPASRF